MNRQNEPVAWGTCPSGAFFLLLVGAAERGDWDPNGSQEYRKPTAQLDRAQRLWLATRDTPCTLGFKSLTLFNV